MQQNERPLAFSDQQMRLLTRAAEILPASKRDLFLRVVEQRLKDLPVSDLTLTRVIRSTLGKIA